jgi:hypothetical protein
VGGFHALGFAPALPFLLFGLGVVLVIVVAILGHLQEKKRREAFLAIARRLELRYRDRDVTMDERYHFLDPLQQGSDRYAFNILEGTYRGYAVQAFDYHYETYSRDSKGRRKTDHHYFSYFILEQELSFPELRIYPETFFSKLGQMIGFDDIDFESAEFSRAFTVRSKDKRFAYDICNADMMQYLLRHRNLSLEIEGRCLALSFNARLQPHEVEANLDRLIAIREMFPEYLYRT